MNAGPGGPLPRRRPQHQIVTATAADTDALGQVIADAFYDLPQSQWLIPDLAARRDILPSYFKILVEHAMTAGTVYTTADRSAAALWVHISAEGASPPEDYPARLARVAGPWAGRFTAFDATLDNHHPAHIAHHHLAILAVHPGRQGQGTGSALLRAHHAILDDAGLPAYLEAAQWRTRQLYRRHGYLPSGLFYLPEGGPAFFPMARPARQPAPPEGTESVPAAAPGTPGPASGH
jgi:GNAT superfamily N-acetyltransferase